MVAELATPPTYIAAPNQPDKPSVLKSVGIKFVASGANDTAPTKGPSIPTAPPQLLSQATGAAAQHSPQVLNGPVPVQINRIEKQQAHSVAIPSLPSLTNSDQSVTPSTNANSSKPTEILTMPPMLAGVESNSTTANSQAAGTVKIQIDPNVEPNKVVQLAPLVAAEKIAPAKQVAEAAKPMAVSVPLPPPPIVEPSKESGSSKVDIAVGSSTFETNFPEPPNLEDPLDSVAKVDSEKEFATATKTESVEVTTPVASRAPNIVRIPSMTLVQKSVAPKVSEEPALQSVVEKPKPVQPTLASKPLPAQEMPLALPVHSNAVVEHGVPKVEKALHDLPKIQEQAIALSEVVKDDQPALALDEVEQEAAIKLAKARQMSISAPRTMSKPPTAFVAVPVSALKATSHNASENSKVSNYKISDQNSDIPSTDETSGVIEILHRDVRCVEIAGDIEKIEIEDESVCKGIVSDAKGLMLLGVGRGATKVKVWTISESSVNQPPQVLDIAVREAWSNSSHQNGMTIGEATQSIAELFPNSRIAIKSHENGSLTVFGTTESGEQAKQVVSLVRKMFLVPVQDRIAVTSPQ